MGEFLGGCRFKVEEVENGWIIEFHPSKRGEFKSRLQKYCAGPDVADLQEVLHELLYRDEAQRRATKETQSRQAEDPAAQRDQPTPSKQSPE